MNIRNEVSKMKKKGWVGYVAFDKPNEHCSKDWCLFEEGNSHTTRFGKNNVEERILEIKSQNG